MHDRNNASEDSHLLPPPNSTVVATKLEFQAQHWLKIWHTWKVPILCYLFALLADCGDTIRTTPKTRLLEIIICRRYYAEQNPDIFNASLAVSALELPESLCKIADIQGELVTTKTWLKIGENLCGLILAIPFGALADKKGRNFVLMLGIVGQILSEVWILGVCYFSSAVPFGFIYFSILLKSSGGGAIMLSAMVHAILSDVVTPDRRAEAFFHLASTMLLTEILAPPLGSVLMQTWSVFTPLICGFPFELASLAVLSMIPNTIQLLQQHVSCHDGLAPDAPISSIDANHGRGSSSSFTRIKARIEKLSDPILQVWTLISRNRNILLVNISFLVTTLGRETLDFLVQYTSKRFGWSLAKANYLVSFRAIINLILFLFALPALSRFLTNRRGMPPVIVDLWIARGSSLFGIVGPILIGLATSAGSMLFSLLLFTLSSGFRSAIQSYATSLVQPDEVAKLYSSLAFTSIVGTLAASPLVAATFKLGLEIGGAGLGLPFFVTAGFFAISGAAVCSAGPAEADEDEDEIYGSVATS